MPLTRGRYPVEASSWLMAGRPAGREITSLGLPRELASANLAALTSGVGLSVALPLQAGDVVTSLTFVSGATAAGTPTNQIAALYSSAGVLLAQSADALTAAWAANSPKTFTLATPQLAAAGDTFYAFVSVAATTVPTLAGFTVQLGASGVVVSGEKILAQTHGSALTGTAPATIATPTTVANAPLVVVR